jgi:hypothetical protein
VANQEACHAEDAENLFEFNGLQIKPGLAVQGWGYVTAIFGSYWQSGPKLRA